MLESLERIRGFASVGRAKFFSDPRTHEAVAFEVLKLGEASGRVTSSFQRAHSSVPWKRLVKLRNELIHEYFRIDLEDVWKFVEEELDPLERALRGASSDLR
jgi:uncharacterized protein with HEPN domain